MILKILQLLGKQPKTELTKWKTKYNLKFKRNENN